jgi:hypothetical protein
MSLAAVFLLASAAAQAAPAGAPSEPDRGAQVATARVQATILRPAVLRNGSLLASQDRTTTPHSQRRSRDGRVTYEFE